MTMSPLSGDSPDPLATGGLSLILQLLVNVKPTKGRWTVRAVILLGGMGSDWVERSVVRERERKTRERNIKVEL